MFGKCHLCLENAELQYSHLLPKALYRLIGRGSNQVTPDTVQITLNSIRKSSEQARRHLLCGCCEQRLNRRGEGWVLHNCYRGRGRFRFRSDLKVRAALDSTFEIQAYPAHGDEAAQLAYFGLSVVWRASLCDWPCRGEVYRQIDLGPYQEGIRRYLEGKSEAPEGVGLMVLLSSLERSRLEMCFPVSYRSESSHCYRFHIPGVVFVATVGGTASFLAEDRVSVLRPPNPIFLGKVGDRLAQDEQLQLMGRAAPPGFTTPLLEGIEKT
jgi:hypothetical protein